MKKYWQGGLVFILSWLLLGDANASSLPLNTLQLPPGFSVTLYAKVPNARSMTLAPNGIVFVGTRSGDKVYAVIPNQQKTKARKVIVLAQGLDMPNGVAYHQGDLYVAEMGRLLKFSDILHHLSQPRYSVVTDNFPKKAHHGWRYIKFGPDGWLYMGIGAPCNVCISKDPRFATIVRMRKDASDLQVYAAGVRNSVGFAWHPKTAKLWFTDNGRDWLGDNIPPDELNYAPQQGMNFGFPYYYGDNQPDPVYGKVRSAKGMTVPAKKLGPHVAALGMLFYTGKMFPKAYDNTILIAEHGSWNRTQKIGYRVMQATLQGDRVVSLKPFIVGWLQGQISWGRPVDVIQLTDGSVLISDDFAGVIYRVVYHPSRA